MKKILLILAVILLAAAVAPARTNLVNFGYTYQKGFLGLESQSYSAIGIDLVSLTREPFGFYATFNGYYGISATNSFGNTFSIADSDHLLVGFNTILGYGGDINWGPFGLIVGGGVFFDFHYYNEFSTNEYAYLSVGPGVGAHFYFSPGSGDFMFNAGLEFAWNPWYWGTDGSNEVADMVRGQFNINVGMGIGWSFGSGRNSSRRSGGSSGGGSDEWGDDDW